MRFQVLPYVRELTTSFVEHYDDTLFLVEDNWNDFDFCTLFNLYSWINRKLQYIGMVKIGRFGLEKGKVEIPNSFDKLSKEYFSLGQSMEYYEYFASVENGRETLSALQDYVVESNQIRLTDIKGEKVFIKSLRRWDENKKQTIIQYKEILNFKSKTKNYSFTYTNGNNLSIDFYVEKNSFPPTNLHVLTGSNGVGKSKLLINMVKALIGESDELKWYNNFGIQSFAKVIHINLSPFSRQELVNNSKLQHYYLGLDKSEDKDDTSLFIDQMMLISKADKFSLWTKFIDCLENDPILNDLKLKERIIETDIFLSNTDDILSKVFSELSDGHKSLLLMVSCLIAHVSERTIVFIDEPEAHLHPPLVATLIRAIIDILKERNSVGIIVTHSPVVLQEVPKDCIWVLNRFNRYIYARRPLLETFAENLNSIMADQFGFQVQNSGFYYYIREAVARCSSEEEALNLFKYRLGLEGKVLIKMLFLNKGNNHES